MTTRFLYVSRPFNFGYILSLNAEQAATADSACHSSVSYVSGASPESVQILTCMWTNLNRRGRVANYAVVDSNVAKEILSPPSTQSSTDSMECSNQVIDRPISPLLTESSSVGATSLPYPLSPPLAIQTNSHDHRLLHLAERILQPLHLLRWTPRAVHLFQILPCMWTNLNRLWRAANCAVVDSNVTERNLIAPSTQSSTDSMECSNQVIDRPTSPSLTESCSVGATSLPVLSITSASNPDEQSRSSSPPPGREDTAAASPAQADSTRSAPVAEPSSRPILPPSPRPFQDITSGCYIDPEPWSRTHKPPPPTPT